MQPGDMGCEEFVTRVLAATERVRNEDKIYVTDWFVAEWDALIHFQVSRRTPGGWHLAASVDGGTCYEQAEISSTLLDTVEFTARYVWGNLMTQRSRVLIAERTCDGGKLPCERAAVWAFRANDSGSWIYTCGRHLTFSLTESSDGEQAEFTVRRIATEER